jgi:hypothetical protein
MVELACDRALVGLTPDGQQELEGFLGAQFDGRALDLEVAAAAVQLALIGKLTPLPQASADKALKAAEAFFSARGGTALIDPIGQRVPVALARGPMPPSVGSARPERSMNVAADPLRGLPMAVPQPLRTPLRPGQSPATIAMPTEIPPPARLPQRDRFRHAGWFAAAACLALAIASVVIRSGPIAGNETPKIEAPGDGRAALLARAKDVVRADWTAATDPTGKGVAGGVVWSDAEQKGFMTFKGLARNDPRATSYQLWIFDADQDDKYPVDGGVFDVNENGDVVVPITAKIKVHKPKLFALTVERPGGVVVSKRDRLVVTAAIAG